MIDEFHTYVQPKFNPIISDFCTELTGILQETVENQPELPTVLEDFQNWLSKDSKIGKCDNFAIVTCGDWDLKTCLPNQCSFYGIESVYS